MNFFLRRSLGTVLNRMGGTVAQATLNLTDKCAERLRRIAGANELLRITVDSGGCSGYEYKFDIVSDVDSQDDVVFERNGARVVVDKMSMQFLNGATVDYREELIRSAFRIETNPVAKQGCSCGASFSVKEDSL
ncbi:iron sulfur cluster assembly 2 [Trichuris trichiura]|uniref:Iron-sulfur cluster assembly 2 homolog, mitochondrial n=1 Tax=Trichuris trichiura TaxID=36087 RepID=A0A077Z2L5_TRITR|nr:iron sulfur cluster assembly 2 [Trichuris trichiura]